MDGLCDIRRVFVVVVRYMIMVMFLKRHKKCNKGMVRYLKGIEQAPFLEN